MTIRKSFFLYLLVLMSTVSLTSCAKGDRPATNLVFIEETEGVAVVNNGLNIAPGEDAVFEIQTDRGISLVGCDYSGKSDIRVENGTTILTLENVKYPTRVSLKLSANSVSIKYEPNGGVDLYRETSPVVRNYSLTYHKRPNTALGTDLFSREGYTLVSWNTRADGHGTRIGLGSRVTNQAGELTLYAQWEPWTSESSFKWTTVDGGVAITDYAGNASTIVIPAMIQGQPVVQINSGAFTEAKATSVVLCSSLNVLEEGAFKDCSMSDVTMFDNLEIFSDSSFDNCPNLTTLYINAVEAPYGYIYRRESCYADKIDLLILSQGQPKMIFYGGCSMWFNLISQDAVNAFGSEYAIINAAVNGTVSSAVQMQIMANFIESGDILFHTPEPASRQQLMIEPNMTDNDTTLWCGLENNYDLMSLVDLRTVHGVFDSFKQYLDLKDKRTDYDQFYSKDYITPYMDNYGGVAIYRSKVKDRLYDTVSAKYLLDESENFDTLKSYYQWYQSMGVRIYVSYAAVNMDALKEDQASLEKGYQRFNDWILETTGAPILSELSNYLYREDDFYDTNYHLLSPQAKTNTAYWLDSLKAQMIADGIMEVAQ